MTQYLDAVLTGKERLSEEELNNLVTSLYLHKSEEDNYFQTTYASGRVVKEFADKRKKDEVTSV
tara:strand:- start:41 stop:232 length:192 start_codon:yes stop_codon:yes gene_type:complete